MKRIISLLLALVLCFGTIPFFGIEASAATSSAVANAVSNRLPLVTYAMPLSGASKVYSYSDSTLSTKTTGYYIDSFKDQIVITKISSNGKALYVTYPSTSSSTGYRSRWFAADDILGLANVDVRYYTCSSKNTTYRMSSASAVTSYGSISKNDSCAMLGKHTVGGKVYYPTIYPISSGTYNKVSGVRYKLGMNCYAPSGSSSSSTESGVKYTYVSFTLDTSSMPNWITSLMKAQSQIGDVIAGCTVNSWKPMKIVEPLPGPAYNGVSPTNTTTINAPYQVTFKVHSHERVMGFGRSARYQNGCIITSYSCNCGYSYDILAWEIPLPDPSEFVCNQICNTIKIQSSQYYWINNMK